MKNTELGDYYSLPHLDGHYIGFGYTSARGIALDEADNTGLIDHCSALTIDYYIHVSKGNPELLVLCFVFASQYINLKRKFPNINEMGVIPSTNTFRISDHKIKDHYDNINNYCTFARIVNKCISPDILKLFSYSYCKSYGNIHGKYNIEIPDFDAYNKLVLLLGGSDWFEVYELKKRK